MIAEILRESLRHPTSDKSERSDRVSYWDRICLDACRAALGMEPVFVYNAKFKREDITAKGLEEINA